MDARNVKFDQHNQKLDSQHVKSEIEVHKGGAVAGLIAVLLMIILVFSGVPAFESNFDFQDTAQKFAAAIEEYRQALGMANFVIALNGVLILWFSASLYTILRQAEDEPGMLSAAAFSAGMLWAFVWILYAALVSSAIELPGFYQNPEGAKTAMPLAFHMALSPIILLLPAVMVGATAIISLQTGMLPRWLGWISIVFALLNVVASGLGSIFGAPAVILAILSPLWVAVTSIVLIRKSQRKIISLIG